MKTLFLILNLLTFLYSSSLISANALSPTAGEVERICDDQLINQNCGRPEISSASTQITPSGEFGGEPEQQSQPQPLPNSSNQGNSGSGQPGFSQPFASNNQGNSGSGQPGLSQPLASNNLGNSGSGQQGFGQPFGSNNNQGNSGSSQAFSGTNFPFLKNTQGNNIPFTNEASDEKHLTLLVVLLSALTLIAAIH